MPFLAYSGPNDLVVRARDATSTSTYHCPRCGGSMHLRRDHVRRGFFVQVHFVHDDATDCIGGDETLIHEEAKRLIGEGQRLRGHRVEIDTTYFELPDGSRRKPDVAVWGKTTNQVVAIEIQRSSISADEYRQRRKDQQSLGHYSLWIWILDLDFLFIVHPELISASDDELFAFFSTDVKLLGERDYPFGSFGPTSSVDLFHAPNETTRSIWLYNPLIRRFHPATVTTSHDYDGQMSKPHGLILGPGVRAEHLQLYVGSYGSSLVAGFKPIVPL